MDWLPTEAAEADFPGSPARPLKIAMVLPEKDFNDDEYALSRAVFDEAAARSAAPGVPSGPCLAVQICSTSSGRVRGSFGTWVEVDRVLREVDVRECAALVFIGGAGVSGLFDSRVAHRLVADAVQAGCVVAAICAAPAILARSGVLDMKRATAHPSCHADLAAHGAVLVDEPVVVSDWMVTAVGPVAAGRFAREIVRLVLQSGRGRAA